MADDDARNRRPDGAQNDDDDGVREAVEATHATVHSALDRIRASREILADSLKPIDELLVDLRENGGRASDGTGSARRVADGGAGGASGSSAADASPPPGA